MNRKACEVLRSLIILFLLGAMSAQAAEPQQPPQQPSAEELAKQSQNPIANLISVPLQNNFYFGTGSKNRTVYVGNLEPVIPIHITDDWNVITRTILPIINQPSLFPGMSSATGLGDLNPTFFLSPAKPGELIWGAGADIHIADRHRLAFGERQIQHGSCGSGADNTRTLAFWGAAEQPVVGCRLGPEERKRVPASAVRELQSSRRLVFDERTDHDGQLESRQGGRCVDGSARWRCGQTIQNRQAPDRHATPGLRQCRKAAIRG